MLLESMVRQTLSLCDHRVIGVEGDLTGLAVRLERKLRRRLPCSGCGERCRVRDRLPEREWSHVPCWGIPTTLIYRPARVRCPNCGIKVEALPWASGKSRLTSALLVVLATWSRLLAWDVVARLFGVSWSTVQAAVAQAVDFGLAHRESACVVYIGIDEISRRRGHIYHTQVYDLTGKRLLWSAEGRDAATLRRFFEEWGAEKTAKIRGVCCDMWAPYMEVVRQALPGIPLVFDKFHLIRHLLKAVNEVRRGEAKELSKTHPDLLAGTRYLWLKNPSNLTPRQQQRLSYLERMNLKINRAYLLKEAFSELWIQPTKQWAKCFLDKWFSWATRSRLPPLRRFAWMVRRHQDGILAWFDVPLDNGATEAMNNNAKAISHRARGFRSERNFTLAQLHCLGKLPLPSTVHKFA